MTRRFHLGDILTIVTGNLVSPRGVEGAYDLCGYMTGDTLWTHQLPRAFAECKPALLAQHPQLAAVKAPEEFDGEAAVWSWLAARVDEFGEYLEVAPLAAEDHTRIDPVAELRMMRPDMPVVGVWVDGDAS